ncbi:hypothetical protein [Roseibium suaedae]|uniref:Cytochrome-c oxidase n=1 Tax=Roseibium suaedae TaxID=735517 RepID=A0A1M6ZFS8_9HYPH|nr:hypothetical protein [Roseibium suaedae]SHL29229.1 hypothetical protein SAMN05444272_0224 [Roseibium suaedae]
MRGVALWFFVTAILYVIAGMLFGIHMSASQDHSLAPAHAHLNLVGWASMGLFGLYYHCVPKAAEGLLPKIHFIVATIGLWVLIPGIVSAIQGTGDIMAKAGSVLTVVSAVLFLVIVVRSRAPAWQ